MMEWADGSDGSTRFFNADSDLDITEVNLKLTFRSILDFCSREIVGRNNAAYFDTLFFEAGCDSGRLIVAVGTLENQESGNVDGCSVYLERLQDYWYDLRARCLPGSDFCGEVESTEAQLAELFSQILTETIRSGGFRFPSQRLRLIAYGSEPGEVLIEKFFSSL